MKRVIALCVVGLLAACGDDDDDGGGPPPGSSVTLTGPLAGPIASSTALSLAGQCSPAGLITVSGTAVAVAFTTASIDACQYLQQNREPANATTAVVTVARFSGASQTPLTAGAYTVGSTPTFDTSGNASYARVDVVRSAGPSSTPGEGCEDAPGETEHAAGTVTITSATATRVAGSLDVTLRDGGRISGPFDVPICPFNGLSLDPTTCEPQVVASGPTTCQ
jgi:hypothetical protein